MRHRYDEARTPAGSLPLEERREDLGHRPERAGREIGDLDRGEVRRSVLEGAGPAEIVHVVASAGLVARVVAEPRDRAVDGRLGDVARADAQPVGDAWAEALEHDVRSAAEGLRERLLARQLAHDGLAPRSQRAVPRRRRRSHRISARRLDANDAGAEPHELATGVRTGEIPREIDDERVGERLHAGERSSILATVD